MNPYWNQDFLGFFSTLFVRLWLFITGALPLSAMADDEVQLAALLLLSTLGALLGSFLVLRRQTMLANSLSHTILLGLVIAALITGGSLNLSLSQLTLAALLTGVLTTGATQFLEKRLHLQKDASIGLVFSAFFALGVALVTVTMRSSHIGIEAVMGNIDAIHFDDLKSIFWMTVINGVLTIALFKEYKTLAFDETYASFIGIPHRALGALFMIQVSALTVGAFRVVGVLLILNLLVAPVLIARHLSCRLIPLIAIASGASALVSLLSIALSRHLLTVYSLPLSTSGLLVTLLSLLYFSLLLFPKKMVNSRKHAT